MLLNVTSAHKYGGITNKENNTTDLFIFFWGGRVSGTQQYIQKAKQSGGKSKTEIANYSLSVIYTSLLGGKLLFLPP